ncbi:MAG: FecR domain-containing protein [[Clostridium] fimetarium]|nr:FecR domain-containing protein [Alistipes timonensis]MCM1405529.1 FecR domain-containing protein [[Clostridium] fimetarium]
MRPSISKLLKKYRRDEISRDEMRELRESVDAMADSDLERLLTDDWDEFNSAYAPPARRRWVPALLRVAAAAAVVLLAGTAWHLHRELSSIGSATATIASTPDNNSLVTLPDGTAVILRQSSRLTYAAADFAGKRREVTFEGEGFFDVKSDASHPFVISAPGFQAIVKGTSFNLYGSPADSIAELSLVSGSVELRTADGAVTPLKPSQKAVINRLTGSVTLATCGGIKEVTAWQRDEIALENATSADIARAFNRYYGVNVTIGCDSGETFTGTLPISSMPLAMKVVQLALGCEVTAQP